MERVKNNLPVMDLHCDLLSYLIDVKGADASGRSGIGCTLPFLIEGNVRIQVAAAYSTTFEGSSGRALEQAECLGKLVEDHPELLSPVSSVDGTAGLIDSDRIGMILALENASSFCEEDEPLDRGFARLDEVLKTAGRIMYITMTHHGANRFGGGNTTDEGLKKDGMALLDHMNGREIAVDLSHTSDALAKGILDYIDRKDLAIPVLASHSNFRALCEQPRNLTDEVAKAIIRRGGAIGICFIRDFLSPDDPGALGRHIEHGLELGGRDTLCLGADFFSSYTLPVQSRSSFYFPEHENAGKYPGILESLGGLLDGDGLAALAYRNAMNFLGRVWPSSKGGAEP
jgi:microsomal dipeptidase-like Zn-dependent dipeptidase